MIVALVFGSGVAIGVLFRDQIVGFKARAGNAIDAAVRSFNGK